MYLNIDDSVTHDARVFEYEIANNTNIRLNLKVDDKVIGFVCLLPPEISHIMRLGLSLPVFKKPE